jgi:hypothetical protein
MTLNDTVQFNKKFCKDYVQKSKRKGPFKEVIIYVRIILKWTLKSQGTRLIWLSIKIKDGPSTESSGSIKSDNSSIR